MTTPWRQRPDVPLPIRVVGAAATALGVAAILFLLTGARLPVGSRYPFVVAAVVGLLSAVVAGRIAQGHPFPRLGPANHVTLVRAMLVALVAGLVVEPPAVRAAWFIVGATALAAVLDGVDGWLARRTRMASDFGARFDMETDALLILVLSIVVWRFDKAGVWVLACGLMRYAFAAAGWVLPWMAAPLTPTFRGKAVAVLQVVGLAVALSPGAPSPASDAVAAVTLTALVWSFGVDVLRLWITRRG